MAKGDIALTDAQRAILDNIHARPEHVPFSDFRELYDSAHAVIDHLRNCSDHYEYVGGMNAVEDFREIAARLWWRLTKPRGGR